MRKFWTVICMFLANENFLSYFYILFLYILFYFYIYFMSKRCMIYLCCRHLYIPVVEMGYGKTTASVTVFFISAFFHEYLVSVPLKTFKIWAFMGMMGQVRLPPACFDYTLLTVQILTLASRNSCLSFKNRTTSDSFNNVLISRPY